MITKQTIRDSVHFILAQRAEAYLLNKNPDVYYGWVAPAQDPETGKEVPGYWLGEQDERNAEHRKAMAYGAVLQAERACRANEPNADKRLALAEAGLKAAEQHLDEVRSYRERTIESRRNLLVDRMVAKLFIREYRKSVALEWDLYNPAIPENLRNYVVRQLARPIGPTSRVYLYLLVQETIQHGEEFTVEAVTAYDYLADNPLVTKMLDIDVPEDQPSAQRRAYVRELQAKAIRDRQEPAHPNMDPRDILADFEYDGLPEQLGAMWIDKSPENSCPKCKQGLRVRMVHADVGYRWAKVCPNYADQIECHNEFVSPARATRKELRDWAAVEYATTKYSVLEVA